jgi:serine phosphatase RsbU (regulator of sigma subunit)/CHASE2 domain-containing sensor protein
VTEAPAPPVARRRWPEPLRARALWRRRGRPFGVVVLALLAALLVAPETTPLRRLRLAGFDVYQSLLPRVRSSEPAIIVDIDESSLARYGQWPWPRTLLARLLAAIGAARPAAIGIDILLVERDRLSPEQLAAAVAGADPGLAAQLERLPHNDDVLAETIRQLPVVLGVAGLKDAEPTATLVGFRAPPIRSVGGDPAPFPPRYVTVIRSVRRIDAAAAGRGLLSFDPEFGVARRIPLLGRVGETLVPTLGLEMLRVASGQAALFARVGPRGLEAVGVGGVVVPTQPDGSMFIHYGRPDASRFISAAAVLDGRAGPELFARKLVLVGITAVGVSDFQATPVAERMYGVEIHAQAIEGIVDGDVLSRPRWIRGAEAAALVVGGALLVWLVPSLPVRYAALLFLPVVAAPFAVALVCYRQFRILFDAASPAVALGVLFAAMLGVTLGEAQSHRRALRREVERQREASARLAGELEAARRIQMGILPSATAFSGDRRIELYALVDPAREVGGDLYDFFRVDDGHLFFLIGDVSGKGLPGCLFMALSKSLCKSIALRGGSDLGAMIRQADLEISRENPEGMFVTAWVGLLDVRTGALAYCAAGHDGPHLLRRAGASPDRLVTSGGPPLCVVDDFPYETATYRMAPGDTLCLITDGVTEAMSPSGELYGRERLEAMLARLAPETDVDDVGAAIRGDVAAFEAGREPADDLAILVIRWTGSAASTARS